MSNDTTHRKAAENPIGFKTNPLDRPNNPTLYSYKEMELDAKLTTKHSEGVITKKNPAWGLEQIYPIYHRSNTISIRKQTMMKSIMLK